MRNSFFVIFMIQIFIFSSQIFAAGDAEKGKQVYLLNCTACHNMNPAKDGALGPAVKGASPELLEFRLTKAGYPKGYKPKRPTKMMPPMPHLKGNIDDLAKFLK